MGTPWQPKLNYPKMHPLKPSLVNLLLLLFTFSCSKVPINLHYYKAENTELMPPKPDDQRIVFMGNSITEFWLDLRPEFFASKPYVNRGIAGETTPQMLGRFQQDVVDLEPAVVVLLAGINDIAGNTGPATIEEITDNIVAMIELAQANDIQVVLCSVLPAANFPWQPELKPAQKVVELNVRLKAYATAHELSYVDYYSPMVDEEAGLKQAYGEDGVHPNVAGYLVMEPLLERALEAF